ALAWHGAVVPAAAQELRGLSPVEVNAGAVGRAAVEAIRFQRNLERDSVVRVIACSMDQALGEAEFESIRAAVDTILETSALPDCDARSYRTRPGAHVFLDRATVVRSNSVLPVWDQINVDIELRIINGHFQEWYRLTLRPGVKM